MLKLNPIEPPRYVTRMVMVTGHVKMDVLIDGNSKLLNSRYTKVWIKGAKGWQMVAWQSTPAPARPA